MSKHHSYKVEVSYTDSAGKKKFEVVTSMGEDREHAITHIRVAAKHEGWTKLKFKHVTLQ